MKRKDRIKLEFVRNWKFPGKERLAGWLRKSAAITTALKDGIIWLTEEDIAIYTTADNYIEHVIMSTGTYEAEIGKLIRTSLKPGYIALDVGANIGLQTIRMSQCCGDSGVVYSFEPLSHIRKKFDKNISLNCCKNVKIYPFALSDINKISQIKIDQNIWNQGSFSLNKTESGNTLEQITVKIGDEIPEIKDLHKLHLLKIDVEGFEYHVLRGFEKTLLKHKPRIIFEYDINYWNATNQSIGECYSYLTSINYTFYQVTQVGCELIKTLDQIIDGNLYCLPN